MADIFISYAHEDRDWVQRLAAQLESQGWSVWWDPKIPAGKTFRQVIDAALTEARCVVVAWSPKALNSHWVLEEADEGQRRRILVPVFKESVVPPLGFRSIQAADLSRWQGDVRDAQFQALVADITGLIGVAQRPAAKTERAPAAAKASTRPPKPAAKPTSSTTAGFPTPTLILVPAGKFLMGTSEDDIKQLCEVTTWAKGWRENGYFKNEQPQHAVELDEYRIGKHPVTNAEYELFVKETQRRPPDHWPGGSLPTDRATHPVVQVSWDDAAAYCEWLTPRMRQAGGLAAREAIRLPTEAEWEKAARGTDGRWYPWGNAWDAAKCNSSEGGANGPTPVGRYSPAGDSPYGVADMAGNVWEWCADFFGATYYANSPAKNPRGPAKGDGRVLRGGSFGRVRGCVRCAYRFRHFPHYRLTYVGFRVVASPF